jgi:hypothetical protein
VQTSKWLRILIVALFATAGLWTHQIVTAAEESGAMVSFTTRALNPADPRLPLADTSGGQTTTTTNKTPSQVVVNTTPEKTKVATTTAPAAKTPATSQRTRLPQTGSVALPVLLVALMSVSGLGLSLMLLVKRRTLAE